jgi:hypothetical protein
MAVSVVMPALEMAQETGKLVSWKKKEGEQVKKGEILLEVETDKAWSRLRPGRRHPGRRDREEGDVVPVTIARPRWRGAAGEDRVDRRRSARPPRRPAPSRPR